MTQPSNYVVIAAFTAKSGTGEELLSGLKQHAANCLQKEPACLVFDVSRDNDDPDKVVAYEVYTDRAGFDAHAQTDHLAWYRENYGHLVADRDIRHFERMHGNKASTGANKILVTAKPLHRYSELLQPLDAAGYDVVLHEGDRLSDPQAVVDHLDGVVATIASIEPYNDFVFSKASSLRVVARLGVGYDQVDVAAATRHNVGVAMTFGANHEAVADHIFAMVNAIKHRLIHYDRSVRDGGWGTEYHGGLSGLVAGIVGFGRIGRAFAKRCQGFNMKLLVADPFVDAATVSRLGAELVSLEKLLSQSDIVSLHTPLDSSTHHLMNADRFSLMKKSAIIANSARGPVIDEAALIGALEAGDIAGAALDVFDEEPLKDSKLTSMDNVILSPHVAGLSDEAIIQMGKRCVSNIIAVLNGRDPGGGLLLNPEALGLSDEQPDQV